MEVQLLTRGLALSCPLPASGRERDVVGRMLYPHRRHRSGIKAGRKGRASSWISWKPTSCSISCVARRWLLFGWGLTLLLGVPIPGGVAASQCPKEDSRSSGASHEPTGTKRTYDMMEGRISRGLSSRDPLSASIEGRCGGSLSPMLCLQGPHLVSCLHITPSHAWQWFAGTPLHIAAGQRGRTGAQTSLCAFGFCPGVPISGLQKRKHLLKREIKSFRNC